MFKRFMTSVSGRAKTVAAALGTFFVLTLTPALARADAISDAINDFDTSNIFAAGAAIIGLVIAIVGIRAVVKLMRGAA